MAFITTDPNAAGPFQSFQLKDLQVRVHKIGFASFTTTGVNLLLGSYPPDTAFVGFDVWTQTALAGGGITSPVYSLGNVAAGTQFASAVALTNTTGTQAKVTPVTGILQEHDPTNRTDINLWFRGACSTGNPTSGSIYVVVYYAR
jgi:hypothetical protein